MATSWIPSVTMVIASAAVMVAGAAGAYGEIAPYFTAGINAKQRMASLSSQSYLLGTSTASKSLLLDDCEYTTTSIRGYALPLEQRKELLTSCLGYALEVVSEMPTSGKGWVTVAKMAASLNDHDTFNRGLQMAHLAAPDSSWLASERVLLAEKNDDWLDDKSRDLVTQDMIVLMQDRKGTEFLAQLYNGNPDYRERITAVVETLSDEQQRLFLQLYKATAGAGS